MSSSGDTSFSFRLYIAGGKPQSMRAIANLNRICEKHFKGQFVLEVIDVYKQREAVAAEGLLALPTLIKTSPLPSQRVIGDLSDESSVLRTLGLSEDEKATI